MALYHSVRDLLPLKIFIKDVIDNLGIDSEKLLFVSSSTVYENNNSAIVMETRKGHCFQVSLVQVEWWGGGD